MNLLVNHNKKWGYLPIPKCAGTSILEAYKSLDPSSEEISGNGTLDDFVDVSNYFLFSFVRNPYTRFGSLFLHERRRGNFKSQDKFVKFIKDSNDIIYYPQSYFIKKGSNDTKKINFIGKIENIVVDINKINDIIGYRKISTLPTENKNPILKKHTKISEKTLYSSLLNDNSIEFIQNYYKEDFERFGYELDI